MSKGIITGAADLYIPTLELFALSCQEQGIELAVFDDGLCEEYAALLESYDVTWLDPIPMHPFLCQGKSTRKIPIEAYQKPFKCLQSPFDQTIWIDADAVPLRGLDEMFNVLDRQEAFFVFPFTSPDMAASLELLGRLCCPSAGIVPLNSGVVGWNKGNEIIDLWAATTFFVTSNPILREKTKTCDQDMLCYAVNTLGKTDLILLDIKYNTPPNFKMRGKFHEREQYLISDPKERLKAIRIDHPESYIVHWVGPRDKLEKVEK